MTKTGSNQNKQNKDEKIDCEKIDWMNNPDTIYSLSDISDERQDSSFVLVDHGNVVASKQTARAEAHNKGQRQAPPADLLERIRSEIEGEVSILRLSDCPLGVKLVLIARAYGRDPEQWLAGDRVSNLFVEAVFYSAGLNLPWGLDAVPDYAELKYVLGQDKRFTRVFRADKLRPQESARAFAACTFEDGDLAVWASNGRRLSCFLEKGEAETGDQGGDSTGADCSYNVLCGGCPDAATGFLYTTLDYYRDTYVGDSAVPDVVYRATRAS